MKTRLSNLWYSLRSNFWVLPTFMAAMSVVLSIAMYELDQWMRNSTAGRFASLYQGGPEGAQALLGATATSMMTVAATTFSVTVVALTLASSQFGPRILRNFMRDRGNQVVLGTFISTFIYCLLVLRRLYDYEETSKAFMPHLSVTMGILLAMASLGVLIYFIHHVSTSIQVEIIAASISTDLNSTIDRLFPEEFGHSFTTQEERSRAAGDIPENFEEEATAVLSNGSGYLQAVDTGELMEIASRSDLLIRLETHPGKFVVQGGILVMVWPGERVDEKLMKRICDVFILGPYRTATQDVEYGIHQLVEIAVRSLSPGINDPFSAMTCINWLGDALVRFVERNHTSPYRYDAQDRLRIIIHPVSFSGLTDAAFNQIRQYGKGSAAVLIRLIEVIGMVALHVRGEGDRAALFRHVLMIERQGREGLAEEWDREDLRERCRAVVKILEERR